MTVALSVAVQHHPSRADLIPALLERLDGLTVEVVADPDPDGVPSPWRTYRECLRRTPNNATHRLIIQDDAVPCVGFSTAVHKALAARPDKPVAFFVCDNLLDSAVAILKAAKAKRRWVDLSPFAAAFPCVAASWPTDLVWPLLQWAEAKGFDERHRSDDAILEGFLRSRRIWPLATVPPLVQHPDVVPSLNQRRLHARRRWVACMEPPEDASLIEW